MSSSRWNVCVRQLRDIWRKCTSCSSCILLLLAIFPLSCAVSLPETLPQPETMDEIAYNFVTSSAIQEGRDTDGLRLSVFLTSLISSAIVIFLSISFEYHMCCNVMFVRGQQRVRERNKEIFKVVLFTVMALAVHLATAIPCFYCFGQLNKFNATRAEINHLLFNYDERRWNKIQIWFECCGIDNYNYWINNTDIYIFRHTKGKIVPDSCCKDYKTGCGNFTNIDQINEEGCLESVTTHINDQIRYHTQDTQAFLLNASVILISVSTLILCWAGRKCNSWAGRKCNSCLKCCPGNRQNINDEIDNNNRNRNDHGQEIIENNDIEERGNVDDTIVNIENEDDNNDNVNDNVNDNNYGAVNGAMEMDEIVVVHRDDVDNVQQRLLE